MFGWLWCDGFVWVFFVVAFFFLVVDVGWLFSSYKPFFQKQVVVVCLCSVFLEVFPAAGKQLFATCDQNIFGSKINPSINCFVSIIKWEINE